MFRTYKRWMGVRPSLHVIVVAAVLATSAAGQEIVSVEKIWDRAEHSAFTDLARFGERWFCTFREGDAHIPGKNGTIRVITSTDGRNWESAGLLAESGIDLRDPKLSVTADGRLMIVAGGSVYPGDESQKGRKLTGRQPRVAFSADGFQWTAPQRVLDEGDWLWRVTWYGGRAYGAAYRAGAEKDWGLTLVGSADGVRYEPIQKLAVTGRPNETTLRFQGDGTMIALVRREEGNQRCWTGSSRPPYTQWSWHETGHRIGGPNFIRLPNGQLWAAGRSYPGGARTVVARMDPEIDHYVESYRRGLFHRRRVVLDPVFRYGYEPVLTLPSGGDTSYPGLVWHQDLLWMSYYSSHEGKSAIYLARIRLD